jgi:hypothetical protein
MNVINSNVSENELVLTVAQTGASYQWVDCNDGNSPISGATSQSYTVTQNGSYAVEIELNGCNEVSSCVTITTVGLEDIKTDAFHFYPNPASTLINVEMETVSGIRIFDVSGKLLKEMSGASTYSIDVTDLTPGIYMIESAEGAKAKFVKQ